MDRRDALKLLAGAAALPSLASFAQVTPPGPADTTRRLQQTFRLPRLKTDPFQDQPRSSFAWVRGSDKLYILGGHLGPYHTYPEKAFSRELLEYDLASKTWRRLAEYPYGVQGARMVHDGDSLFVFGGFRYSSAFDYSPNWRPNEIHWSAVSDDEVYRYETKRDRWQRVATMPRRRSSNVLLRHGRKVYVVGGWDGTLRHRGVRSDPIFHAMIDVFDLDKQDFIPFDVELPVPLRRALTAAEFNGKLALFGGLGSNPTGMPPLLDTATVFDPATGKFSDAELPKLKTTLFSAGACYTGAKFVVAGGQPTFSSISDEVYVLRPGDTDWVLRTRLSKPAMFVELLPLAADRVLVFGGHSEPDPVGLWEEITV